MNFSSSPFLLAFILLLDKKVDKKENDKSRGGTQRNILKNIYAHFKALCI